MYHLQTAVRLPEPPSTRLDYGNACVSLGSCFSEHIGAHLQALGHRISVHPYGALYNPLSIAEGLARLVEGRPFTSDELLLYDDLYHSSMHHGYYSAATPEASLERINSHYGRATELLARARYLLLTWGTAYVYRDRQTGRVVANCHKRPERCFDRRLATPSELVASILPILEHLLAEHPELTIISTISPIRHLRDGAHANQVSKATLMLMDRALAEALGDRYHYFPAYEILLDELRDYRFYSDDLCHPSPLAIRIIRERFVEWLASPTCLSIGKEVERLRTQWLHRPLHPDHPEAELRRQQLAVLIRALMSRVPELDLSSWFDDEY